MSLTVHIFIPCYIDQLYPQVGVSMVKVLRSAGCTVKYNPNQTCCGQPAFNAGFHEDARHVADKFLKDFLYKRYVVVPSGSCAGFVRNYYQQIFKGTLYDEAVRGLKNHVFEFTDFMVNHLGVRDVGATFKARATYHDGCGTLHECGIKTTPRILLQKVKELELIEMEDAEVCCGFGGTFSIKNEPISIAMAEQKTESAQATAADFLISTDMSCLMHLDGYLRKSGQPMQVMHIAEVLAQGLKS